VCVAIADLEGENDQKVMKYARQAVAHQTEQQAARLLGKIIPIPFGTVLKFKWHCQTT